MSGALRRVLWHLPSIMTYHARVATCVAHASWQGYGSCVTRSQLTLSSRSCSARRWRMLRKCATRGLRPFRSNWLLMNSTRSSTACDWGSHDGHVTVTWQSRDTQAERRLHNWKLHRRGSWNQWDDTAVCTLWKTNPKPGCFWST